MQAEDENSWQTFYTNSLHEVQGILPVLKKIQEIQTTLTSVAENYALWVVTHAFKC